MPYMIISNVRVEEVSVEKDEGEFVIVRLQSGGRIRIRKNRISENREALEEKIGIKKNCRTPADFLH